MTGVSPFPHRGCCWNLSGVSDREKLFIVCRLHRLLEGFDFNCSSLVLLFSRKLCWLWNIQQFQCKLKRPLLDQQRAVFLWISTSFGAYFTVYFGAFKVCALLCFGWSHKTCCSPRVRISQSECKLQFVRDSTQQDSQDPAVIKSDCVKDLHWNDKCLISVVNVFRHRSCRV